MKELIDKINNQDLNAYGLSKEDKSDINNLISDLSRHNEMEKKKLRVIYLVN